MLREIRKHPDAQALILTSCTYDGLRYDLNFLQAWSRPDLEQLDRLGERARKVLTAAAVIVGAGVILFDPIFQGLAISLMAGEVASLLISRMAVPVLLGAMACRYVPIDDVGRAGLLVASQRDRGRAICAAARGACLLHAG